MANYGDKLKKAVSDRRKRTLEIRAALARALKHGNDLNKLGRQLHKAHKPDQGRIKATRTAILRTRGQIARLRHDDAASTRELHGWQHKLAQYRAKLAAARRHPYPHLRGDLTSNPRVRESLECMGRKYHVIITVTSGKRSLSTAWRLWNNRHSNPYPVAYPCQSNHCEGNAADAIIAGRPIQNYLSRSAIESCGLIPLAGDAVHVSTNGR